MTPPSSESKLNRMGIPMMTDEVMDTLLVIAEAKDAELERTNACLACRGTGEQDLAMPPYFIRDMVPCHACNGSGKRPELVVDVAVLG